MIADPVWHLHSQQHNIPPKSPPTLDLRYNIYESGERTQRADCNGVAPFGVRVFILFMAFVQISAVETNDGDGENEL